MIEPIRLEPKNDTEVIKQLLLDAWMKMIIDGVEKGKDLDSKEIMPAAESQK